MKADIMMIDQPATNMGMDTPPTTMMTSHLKDQEEEGSCKGQEAYLNMTSSIMIQTSTL